MIRIGIVGCGRILAAHLRGYRLLRQAGVDDFRITALCARKPEDALGYVKRDGDYPQRPAVSDIPGDPLAVGDEWLSDFQGVNDVEVFTDYREMIASGKVDAVNDFTTHGMHHLVGMEAIEHGLHLLTQKPLAVTVKAAARMVEAAEHKGLTFGVFENARQAATTRHWQWAIESDLVGKPKMVLFGNVGTWWAPDLIVAETPWRHQLVQGGGISLDLGVHQFHMVQVMAGDVSSVTARTVVTEPTRYIRNADDQVTEVMQCDADDTFYASFAAESGTTGTLFGSWSGAATNTVLGEGPTFYGEMGRISGDLVHIAGETEPQSLEALYAAGAGEDRIKKDFPLGLEDDFAIAQLDWLRAIRSGQQPETSAAEGLKDLACAYAIVESAHAGQEVSVADVLSGAVAGYQDPINQHFQIH